MNSTYYTNQAIYTYMRIHPFLKVNLSIHATTYILVIEMLVYTYILVT